MRSGWAFSAPAAKITIQTDLLISPRSTLGTALSLSPGPPATPAAPVAWRDTPYAESARHASGRNAGSLFAPGRGAADKGFPERSGSHGATAPRSCRVRTRVRAPHD